MNIALINMPFGALAMPSLGLTQLKAALDREFGADIDVTIHYLNIEFAAYFGNLDHYRHACSDRGFLTGIGDWFFRQLAFPDAEDTTEAYLNRFYFDDSPATRALRDFMIEKRAGAGRFLDAAARDHGLDTADIIGFTSLFSQTVASFALARHLKQMSPAVTTVVGGAACEGPAGREFADRVDAIDYIFSGPATDTFLTFVRHWLTGERNACDRIDGVLSRRNRCAEAKGGTADPDTRPVVALRSKNADSISPLPLDYTTFLAALERHYPEGGPRPVLLFQTSEGCWWAERQPCRFCGLNGMCGRFRALPAKRALSTIRSLFRYAPRVAFLQAVDNVLPPGYPETVFTRLEPPPGLAIQYEVRPALTEAQIAALCRGGVTRIQPGIESLCTSTLACMHKGLTAFDNIQFLKACSRYPIELDWNLLLFAPGEAKDTWQHYLDLIPRLAHLHPPRGAFPVNYVRHSSYFGRAGDYGLDLEPQDFYALTYPFDAMAVRNIASHFVDRRADAERLDRALDALNDAIRTWRRRWLSEDGLGEARLCLLAEDDRTMVYDSRRGRAVTYAIGAMEASLLAFLDHPRSEAEVAAHAPDAAAHLGHFRQRELLFEEDGQLMSLLCRPSP